ncbi:MAG: transporter, family, hexuronate transporter [Chthoniobacter sp.]|jgi:ACS family hexuronate transporter-like MFS transporter|nr:transporter, family, hexuronate transporter [Chthoniobacter sp.]
MTNNKSGNCRWVICGLLFFSVAVNYIDRLVIGILKKPISASLGWTDQDYGYIAAFFSFAYAFGYLLGGRLIDKWGVKRGLPVFVGCWSFAAMAHGFVSFIGMEQQFRMQYPWFSSAEGGLVWLTLAMPMTAAGFVLARMALGLTEGGNFPAAIKTVAEWFPVKERALATGWFNAGTNVGAILCPIGVPWIYSHLGWPVTFYITGGTGLVWLVAWWFTYDEPEKHPRLSREELIYIRSGQPAVEEKAVKVPWRSLLTYRPVWGYVVASILAGPAWGFYQFFVPDFLDKRFHLTLQETGWWTGAFFAIAAVGGVAGGWLVASLLNRGWSLNKARKISLLICALSVVPVFFAPFAGSVWLAVLIVGIAGAAHQGWSANLYSVVSDTMPKDAISSVIGLGGFVAYMTGGFVNGLTGMILKQTGSYVLVFAYFSGTYLLALLAVHLLIPKIRDTNAPLPKPAADPTGELPYE